MESSGFSDVDRGSRGPFGLGGTARRPPRAMDVCFACVRVFSAGGHLSFVPSSSPYVDCRGCNVSIPRAADPIHAQPREARPQTHHSTMTTTLGCFSAGLGRRTDLPWPLPADAGQVREKGYFVEGGKESLPPKWDCKVMARPKLPADISGVDAYHKKLSGEVDGNGEPTIAVFLKTGPPGRAPALVLDGVSVSADASVLADRAAQDLGVPVDQLSYHGAPLDMATPLEAQGVFRDPVLLEWK